DGIRDFHVTGVQTCALPISTTAADCAPPKATRREWIGLAVIAVPCLLYSMDLNVLNLAIPHLTADLNPSSTQLLWIVDIYGFLRSEERRVGKGWRCRWST